MKHNQNVEIEECYAVRRTQMALLVHIGDGPLEGQNIWIPLSQITDDSEVYNDGHEGTLTITEWFAVQKGLV